MRDVGGTGCSNPARSLRLNLWLTRARVLGFRVLGSRGTRTLSLTITLSLSLSLTLTRARVRGCGVSGRRGTRILSPNPNPKRKPMPNPNAARVRGCGVSGRRGTRTLSLTLTLTLTLTLILTGLGSPQAFPSDLGAGLLTLTEIVKGFDNDMVSSEINK